MRNAFKIILVIFLLGGIVTYYMISKPANDYYDLESEYFFESSSQFIDVQEKYVSQVIELKGVITEITFVSPFMNVTLDDYFHFSFEIDRSQKELYKRDEVIIKGRYEGFDDLFEEYTFTDCSVSQ